MDSTHQRQFDAYCLEQLEKRNVDFFYNAFEKSLTMYELAPKRLYEHEDLSIVLFARFQDLQKMLVILADEQENDDQNTAEIGKKRAQMLKKLQKKILRLNATRTLELAGKMEQMLRDNSRELLTAEHVPQEFESEIKLARKRWKFASTLATVDADKF